MQVVQGTYRVVAAEATLKCHDCVGMRSSFIRAQISLGGLSHDKT